MVSHVFPLAASFSKLSTLWKERDIVEKEGGWPVFDMDTLNTSFLPTAESLARW